MSTMYGKPTADDPIHAMLQEVLEEYHPELVDAGVTIGLYWATSEDDESPALKHHGYPAAAVVKIKSDARDRLEGLPDATITIDKDRWDAKDDAWRRSLLDHELFHLQVQRDKDDHVKLDDAGRPKLKMRSHDFEVGVFDAIVARHGAAGCDAQALDAAAHRLTQKTMPWG